MKTKGTTAYLPTVDGKPAKFCNDYQLCVGSSRQWSVVTVPSLREVKRQIAASKRNRERDGYPTADGKYGYVRVVVLR